MNRTLEDRLHAAFEAKAGTVTTQSLRPDSLDELAGAVSLDGANRSGRPGWLMPLLAAAAVAATAVGVTVAMHTTSGRQNQPANHAPTSAPSTPPSPQPTHNEHGATRNTLTVHGVRMTVPKGWRITDDGRDNNTIACISAPGSKDCVLDVAEPLQEKGNVFIPNETGGMNQGGNFCGSGGNNPPTVTVAAREVRIDGQTALYKRYRSPCLLGSHQLEQWVIPTAPGIIFLHDMGTLDRIAERVVTDARLPGDGSGVWLGDSVRIESVTNGPDGYVIHVQRIVQLEQGNYLVGERTTYRLKPAVQISVQAPLGPDCARRKVRCTLTAAQLMATVADGTLSSTLFELWTDGQAVTRLDGWSQLPGHAVTLQPGRRR